MALFKDFRALVGALQDVAAQLSGVSLRLSELLQSYDEGAPLADRVEHLERTRAVWEAEIEAVAMKADSTLKAANNAEARERSLHKSNEKLFGHLLIDGDEGEVDGAGNDPENDAGPVSEEGLLPMREVVAVDPRQALVRAKYL